MAPLLLALMLVSCLKNPAPDPQRAQTLQSQAEGQFAIRDFAAAAATMTEAVAADPTNLELALRLGEFHEFLNHPDQAFAVYTKAAASDNPANPWRNEATYRAALLLMLRLDRAPDARPLLDRIPADTPRRKDGEAVLIMVNGDPRLALTLFNQISQQPLEQFVGARVAYHAALAFGRLNAIPEAYGALFQAINLAGRSIIAQDVERYRDELKLRERAH
jgi:tetratricopeptide (TPR) repeat protein